MKVFEKVIVDCKAGWKTELAQNGKWNVCFVTEQLAFLLALHQQVKKGKAAAHNVKQPLGQSLLQGGGAKEHFPKARIHQVVEHLQKAPQELRCSGEEEGEHHPLYSYSLSSAEWRTQSGSSCMGVMGKVHFKLPSEHACFGDADAVTCGGQCCECSATCCIQREWRQRKNSRHQLISLAAIASAKTVLVARMALNAGAAYS